MKKIFLILIILSQTALSYDLNSIPKEKAVWQNFPINLNHQVSLIVGFGSVNSYLCLFNSTEYKNVIYKGGAQWMGASVDNLSGTMFVNTSNIPSLTWLENVETINSYYRYNSKWKVLRDHLGYPGSKPPWGNLMSINLNTGETNWKVPFGEYESLSKQGIPITGTINFGGVVGTRGGLVFATGTLDNKVRAFDSDNGEELWSYKMKFLGSSPPSIFQHENEQYVVVVSTGSSTINAQFPDQTELGNLVYVFKLKS